ncbi:MAG: arylsulfotransferase family protein [Rickettsiales bacterium]
MALYHYNVQITAPVKHALNSIDAEFEKHANIQNTKRGGASVKEALKKTKAEWNRDKAFNGYTLINIVYMSQAYLLDMTGKVVHQWDLPFRKVWPTPPHIRRPVRDDKIYFEKSHVYPNGDLLTVYMAYGDTPYGYGLVKMDKHSKVIWKYAGYAHHNFHVKEDGTITVLVHDWVKRPINGLEALSYPTLADYIVTLSPNGEELQKISLLEVFAKSSLKEMLFHAPFNRYKWDSTHANSIDILAPEMSAAFPLFAEGSMLLSLRNTNTLAIIDPKKQELTWAYNGLWKGQHSASFLDNGSILLFDNKGYFTKNRAFSRVLEFNPTTSSINWTYTDTTKPAFYSYNRGTAQRLPNGNTLIAESLDRRVFEVTKEGEVVWNYRLPIVYKKIEPQHPPYKPIPKNKRNDPRHYEVSQTHRNVATVILKASRYPKDSLPFINER